MKNVTLEEWIAELESGRWKPTPGELGRTIYVEVDDEFISTENERCCLGVLCEMVYEDGDGEIPYENGFPPPEVLRHVPWLVLPFQATHDWESEESVISDAIDWKLDMEAVLGEIAGINDQMFRQAQATPDEERPTDFSPVVAWIREQYGLTKGEQ